MKDPLNALKVSEHSDWDLLLPSRPSPFPKWAGTTRLEYISSRFAWLDPIGLEKASLDVVSIGSTLSLSISKSSNICWGFVTWLI